MVERNQFVDNMRGLAMLVMILTHATAFFPSDKIAYFLWDWSHFAVPIFVFCSAYLFLKKNTDKPIVWFSYLKKRFLRLLLPYYLFLGFFIVFLLLLTPEKVSFKYILQSVLVIGGVDINWLVLLFLYLTIILPLFAKSYLHQKKIFWLFFVLSLGSAIVLLFYHIPFSYKYIMWLPWSLVLFLTLFYVRFESQKKFLAWLFIICLGMFLGTYFLQSSLQQSLVLIHNKYPPNLYYLSYGFTLFLGLALLQKYLFASQIVTKVLHFFSKHSYSIYFVHYLILTIFAHFIHELHLEWESLFGVVFLLTVLAQLMFNRLKSLV